MSIRTDLLTKGPTGAFVDAVLSCHAKEYLDYDRLCWHERCLPLFRRLTAAGLVRTCITGHGGEAGFPYQAAVLSPLGRRTYFGGDVHEKGRWRFVTCFRRENPREPPHPMQRLQWLSTQTHYDDKPPGGIDITVGLKRWLRRLNRLYQHGTAGAAIEYANLFVTTRRITVISTTSSGSKTDNQTEDSEYLRAVMPEVCTVEYVRDRTSVFGYREVPQAPNGVRYVIVFLTRGCPPLAGVRRDHASIVVPLDEVLDEPDLVDAKLDVVGIL